NLLKDPRHDCVLFANEFQEYSYCPREKGESQEKWQTRCVYAAAVWYYNHLAGLMNVVMITEDEEAVSRFSSLNSGVFVIRVQDYLQNFWPELKAAHELYSAITQVLQEKEGEDSQREFSEHLPAEVLEAGIKSGRFIQGTLNVSKHRPQNEAFITNQGLSTKNPGAEAPLRSNFLLAEPAPPPENLWEFWTHPSSRCFSASDLSSGVLVFGSKSRNRAVHGDMVVVELLPKSEWRGKVTALTERQVDEKSGDESETKAMPTGTGPSPRAGTPSASWSYPGTAGSPRSGSAPSRLTLSRSDHMFFQDHRLVVRLDSWPSTSLYPNGHSVRVLGRAGELETEVQTILMENCIHVPLFSEAQVDNLSV
ncbi:hypothetical protein GOODEAATRI_002555, partial [Goodea atripinnis]